MEQTKKDRENTDRGKVKYKQRKRHKGIRYEKTEIEKRYIPLREQITTKEEKKITTKLKFVRYICAGELCSRDPIEGLQGSQKAKI